MLESTVVNFVISLIIAFNIGPSLSCPQGSKSAYKSGEILDQPALLTLDKIKLKLKQSEIFNWEDPGLSDREKKEMIKMFDAVEIMLTSRNRQPSNVQSLFSSLRVVERVVKKQLKEGQISETLAARFNWDKLINRKKRDSPQYHFDNAANMRIFNLN